MKHLTLVLVVLLTAFTLPTKTSTHKLTGVIVSTSLDWIVPDHIYFECTLDQPNAVDYRVTVGVWMYVNGFYSCGNPHPCYGWHWAYKYYNLIIPAGETFASTYTGGGWWSVNSGEQVDVNNYYISNYRPN